MPSSRSSSRLEGPPGDAVLERLAFQKLHHDEGLPLVLVDVVDGADAGVVEGRGGPGLALEALLGLVAREEPLGQELERDLAAQAGVLGLVDDAHAPAAELLEDAVVGDGLAGHGDALRCAGRRKAPRARQTSPLSPTPSGETISCGPSCSPGRRAMPIPLYGRPKPSTWQETAQGFFEAPGGVPEGTRRGPPAGRCLKSTLANGPTLAERRTDSAHERNSDI